MAIKEITVIQGDCLDVMRKLRAESFDAVLTDPPYGIKYRSTRGESIPNDQRPFIWWLYDAFRLTKSPGALLCFCRWDVQECFKNAIEVAGFETRSQLVWNKCVHGMGNTRCTFAPQHEVLWFATKGDFRFSDHRPSTLYSIPRLCNNRVHPTQKPIDLMRQLVRSITPRNGKVLDPFLGSGTTAIACFEEGRSAVGIDIDSTHISTSRRRLTQLPQLRPGFWF